MNSYLNSIPSPRGFIGELTSISVESSKWTKSCPLLFGEYLTIWSSTCSSSVNDSTSSSILCGTANIANRDAVEQSATNNTEQFACIDFSRLINLSSNVFTVDEIIEHMSEKFKKIPKFNLYCQVRFQCIWMEDLRAYPKLNEICSGRSYLALIWRLNHNGKFGTLTFFPFKCAVNRNRSEFVPISASMLSVNLYSSVCVDNDVVK